MYSYSRRFWPPAPFLEIRVAAAAQSRPATVPALVDTGSDVTSIPLTVAQALQLRPLGPAEVEGVAEGQIEREMFRAFLSIGAREPVGLAVIGWHENIALLGRDILNHYVITLDGPNQTFTINSG